MRGMCEAVLGRVLAVLVQCDFVGTQDVAAVRIPQCTPFRVETGVCIFGYSARLELIVARRGAGRFSFGGLWAKAGKGDGHATVSCCRQYRQYVWIDAPRIPLCRARARFWVFSGKGEGLHRLCRSGGRALIGGVRIAPDRDDYVAYLWLSVGYATPVIGIKRRQSAAPTTTIPRAAYARVMCGQGSLAHGVNRTGGFTSIRPILLPFPPPGGKREVDHTTDVYHSWTGPHPYI